MRVAGGSSQLGTVCLAGWRPTVCKRKLGTRTFVRFPHFLLIVDQRTPPPLHLLPITRRLSSFCLFARTPDRRYHLHPVPACTSRPAPIHSPPTSSNPALRPDRPAPVAISQGGTLFSSVCTARPPLQPDQVSDHPLCLLRINGPTVSLHAWAAAPTIAWKPHKPSWSGLCAENPRLQFGLTLHQMTCSSVG